MGKWLPIHLLPRHRAPRTRIQSEVRLHVINPRTRLQSEVRLHIIISKTRLQSELRLHVINLAYSLFKMDSTDTPKELPGGFGQYGYACRVLRLLRELVSQATTAGMPYASGMRSILERDHQKATVMTSQMAPTPRVATASLIAKRLSLADAAMALCALPFQNLLAP